MANSKIITGACAVVGALGLVATGAALSNAASPSPSSTAAVGSAADTHGPDGGGPGGGPGGGNHTAATATELANLKAAVKAKDSAVTVTSARKDGDGSYDVFGTKAGADVRLEVSKDLKTITVDAGGPGGHGPDGGPGGGGAGGNHTPVTGTELATVTAAVNAKDSAFTVTSARKDGDGSYDVFGTKAGANVRYEVSKDLKTITLDTDNRGGGPRG